MNGLVFSHVSITYNHLLFIQLLFADLSQLRGKGNILALKNNQLLAKDRFLEQCNTYTSLPHRVSQINRDNVMDLSMVSVSLLPLTVCVPVFQMCMKKVLFLLN